MYKVVMLDNYLDSKKVEVYEKEYETLDDAEYAYAEVFEQVKKLYSPSGEPKFASFLPV